LSGGALVDGLFGAVNAPKRMATSATSRARKPSVLVPEDLLPAGTLLVAREPPELQENAEGVWPEMGDEYERVLSRRYASAALVFRPLL
jgi:hypothetical protein